MNLPPLDLKWDKPCVGICYMQRVRGVGFLIRMFGFLYFDMYFEIKGKTKEQIFKEQEARSQKKTCVGLCYLTKVP